MGITLLLVGVMSATAWGRIDSTTMRLFGLSPDHVYAFNLYRLVTSVFFTHGGIIFWRSWAMLCLCLFWCEYEAGTRTTIVVFWLAHVGTIMLLAWVVVPALLFTRPESGDLIRVASDVGPSAGYIGCLAVGTLSIHNRARRMLLWWALGAILLGMVLLRTELIHTNPAFWLADVSHLIAFLLTSAGAITYTRSRRPNGMSSP